VVQKNSAVGHLDKQVRNISQGSVAACLRRGGIYKFSAESDLERIVKICQNLAKLQAKVRYSDTFLTQSDE